MHLTKRFIICFLFIIALTFVNLTVFASRGYAPQKACFSNQRIISGAIEMYNMDHEVMMRDFNDYNAGLLVSGKYLKSIPVGSKPECRYLSSGDLTGEGVIYCEYHGSIGYNANSKDGVAPSDAYYQDEFRENLRNKMYSLAPILVILGAISIVIVALPSKKNKSS